MRNKYGALLRGLLYCIPCNAAMSHSYTVKNKNKRYRYYVCCKAQKQGWDSCPTKSLPAAEIEEFVVDRLSTGQILCSLYGSCINIYLVEK